MNSTAAGSVILQSLLSGASGNPDVDTGLGGPLMIMM